ncbi:hypothetical protein GEMRC1_004501 [Eukaryota sp. GEM-RC1]
MSEPPEKLPRLSLQPLSPKQRWNGHQFYKPAASGNQKHCLLCALDGKTTVFALSTSQTVLKLHLDSHRNWQNYLVNSQPTLSVPKKLSFPSLVAKLKLYCLST